MSRDSCRRSFVTFFDRPGIYNFRQIGSRIDSGRLQIGIHLKTPFSGHKRDSGSGLSKCFNSKRNRQSFKQKCNRKSSEMGCNERFLQYTFSGTKEKWANAASDKFTPSQQVSSHETFQNGHNGKGTTVSRKRRLVNNSRSVRRIFPSEDFQASSKISQIQFSGQSLPISSAKFWSNGSAQNLYEIDVSSSSLLEKTKHTSCNIPGRLANFKSDKENVMARSIYCPSSPFRLGFIINKQKSSLVPSQNLTYIGGHFLSEKGLVFPTPERAQRLRAAALQLFQGQNTVYHYLVLLGKIASCLELIPNARLFMRPIQLHLLQNWSPVRMTMCCRIPVTPSLKPHLRWWLQEANILQGRSVQLTQFTETVTTQQMQVRNTAGVVT